MINKTDIISAYRILLNREPESENVVNSYSKISTLEELYRVFIQSEEFKNRYNSLVKSSLAQPLDWPKIQVETDVSSEQLELMIDRIAESWKNLGESEPYWSVISSEQFKTSEFSKNIEKTSEHFYSSGKRTIELLEKILARLNLNLSNYQVCLEYGCGVGRVTRWLAERFSRVVAYDISTTHINIARTMLHEVGLLPKTQLCVVENLSTLRNLPVYDFFLSIIVLQHNPPPIIGFILHQLLDQLRVGGIGVFQVPTYAKNYSFSVETYLARASNKIGEVEMHVFPQSALFSLFNILGCEVLEFREDSWVGDRNWISNTIVVKKVRKTVRGVINSISI